MAPPVVHNGVRSDEPTTEGLFEGQKFWFSSTVPQKSRFIEDVKANGGEVVPLEKQADICLFDHMRKNPPPGMYSYQYVEHSVRNGQLERLEAHKIGGLETRASRPVGSVTLASKGSRTPFTEADDQFLWDWMKRHKGLRGSAGNALFRQLEEVNPRHTFQSWRDRWLKYVQYQNRASRPGDGRRQHDALPAVDPPTTANTVPRATSLDVDGASELSKTAAEMPVEESARRKRGRPPKNQRKQPSGDTIELAGPAVRSTLQPNSRAKLCRFSEDDRDQVLQAAGAILQVPDHEAGPVWERMAKEHPQHTAEQWRSYFREVILPGYLSQGNKSQQREKTKIAGAGRRKRNEDEPGLSQGKQERGQLVELHPAKIRKTRNENHEATALEAQHRQQSPSSQPQSPLDGKPEDDGLRVETNEPENRSSARSHLQPSARSQTLDILADEVQATSQSTKEEQHNNEYIRNGDVVPAKRPRPSTTEVTVPEIPSTPDHTQEYEIAEDMPGTPTPRAQKQPDHRMEYRLRPLSVPSDRTDEEDDLPTTPEPESEKENIDPQNRRSPIFVHLDSDHDPAIASSSSGSNRTATADSTDSQTPGFETAPNVSQIHEDVSDQEEFETAAEEQAAQNPSMPADTQALFAATTQNGEGSLDLGLHDPEGGWDAVGRDLTGDDDGTERVACPDSPASSTASTLGLDLDAWVALRASEGRDIDLLLTAAEATNMHKRLADAVYEGLESGSGVPQDMKGVWTKEDDELLQGKDARGIERVQKKHGERSFHERFHCLHVWNAQ